MTKDLLTLAIELDFETEQHYFDYIIESKYNGQSQQVKELYNAMQDSDKIRFRNYLSECNESEHFESVFEPYSLKIKY